MENGFMDIANSARIDSNTDYHWTSFDSLAVTPEKSQLQLFSQKLDSALLNLGRIDYQLKNALAQLSGGQVRASYDDLPVQVAQVVSPGVQKALANLAVEITKAKEIADEIGAR
jgi:hypothetical protein